MGKANKRKILGKLVVAVQEVVGYAVFLTGQKTAFDNGEGNVVTSSAETMDSYIKTNFPNLLGKYEIDSVYFVEVLGWMARGKTYCIDEGVFNKLCALFTEAGLNSDLGSFREHCSVGSDFAVIGMCYAPGPELDSALFKGESPPVTDEEDVIGKMLVGKIYCR